jgi:7,8-dihydropterin-6-yl-methyl-4-(beta-D-ribofuranosyl)aminobenzene 5'-phosphate synthase
MEPVDQLEITVLVDNTTDNLSSSPKFVETESAGHWRRGMKWLSGQCLCCAAHGLSCLLTVTVGEVKRTLLFDTGPDEWVFERNTTRVAANLGRVDAMVLSHGHWDHAGAMPRALQMIMQQNGGRPIPVYMHPDMFAQRAMKAPDGQFLPMESVPSIEVLTGNGANVNSRVGGLVSDRSP